MVSALDLAKFSRNAYGDINKQYIINGFTEIFNSDDFNYQYTGYYGIAYRNLNTKEIIIASSGTNFDGSRGVNDLAQDLLNNLEISRGQIPPQFSQAALLFAKKVLKHFDNQIKLYKVFFTGHSLGAVLAELTKFVIDQEMTINSKAITFDSPGSKEIIDKLAVYELTMPINGIISYNGEENHINSCNYPSGLVYRVKTESYIHKQPLQIIDANPVIELISNIGGWLNEESKHTLHHHNLNHIIASLETNIPELVEEHNTGIACFIGKTAEVIWDLYETSNQSV